MSQSPYLEGIPSLPDDALAQLDGRHKLTAEERRRIKKQLRLRYRLIRAARTAWERQHGPVDVEPPALP